MVVPSVSVRDGLVSRRIGLFEEKPAKLDDKADDALADESVRQVHISVIETRDGTNTIRSADTPRASNKDSTIRSRNGLSAVLGPDYVGSRHIAAGVEHFADGHYDKARREFEMALSMQCATVGEKYIGVALSMDNLGATYLQLGNYEQAEQCLIDSLAMKEKLAPKLMIADTLNNLGNCACLRGDFDGSLYYYRRALQELRAKDGSPADIANALFNVGRLEIQRDNMVEAKGVLDETWKFTKEAFGQNHLFAAQTLDLMGYVHLRISNFDAAMVSFTKSLGILRRLYGPIHLEVANSLFNVSMVREAKGAELQEAWESFNTTRDLYALLKMDVNHPRYVSVMTSIAKLEYAISRAKKIKKHGKPTRRRDQQQLV